MESLRSRDARLCNFSHPHNAEYYNLPPQTGNPLTPRVAQPPVTREDLSAVEDATEDLKETYPDTTSEH